MNKRSRIVLITDSFLPKLNSASIQVNDLSLELSKKYEVTVITPCNELKQSWSLLKNKENLYVLKLKIYRINSRSLLARMINEFFMPFFMIFNLRKSQHALTKWDFLIWYSPSVFLSFFVKKIKQNSKCKCYLILRDLFPQWTVDLGLLRKKSFSYWFLNRFTILQNNIADIIGIQSIGNFPFMLEYGKLVSSKVEVLNNWLSDSKQTINRKNILSNPNFINKKIFIYSGNMGLAQNIDTLVELAKKFKDNQLIRFVFVGNGTEYERIKSVSIANRLDNIFFASSVEPDELKSIYKNCHVGLISLDLRHKTHNIPGKFISYIQNGLPVLAIVNKNNDLTNIIIKNDIGIVCESNNPNELFISATNILKKIKKDENITKRCIALYKLEFTTKKISKEIMRHHK